MLKFKLLTTAIRIKKQTGTTTNENDFEFPVYEDLIDEDILCEWKNKFGNDLYQASKENALEPARIRLWYIPGVTADCKIIRLEDNAIFEIVGSPDDVENRHQQLEIEVKRYVKG